MQFGLCRQWDLNCLCESIRDDERQMSYKNDLCFHRDQQPMWYSFERAKEEEELLFQKRSKPELQKWFARKD